MEREHGDHGVKPWAGRLLATRYLIWGHNGHIHVCPMDSYWSLAKFVRWCRRKSQPSTDQGSALRLLRSLMEEQLLLRRDDSWCPYGVSAQTGRAAWLPLKLVDLLCLGLETCIDVTFNRIPHAIHLVEWAEVTYPSCLRAVRRVLVEIEMPEDDWLYEWAHRLYTGDSECWRSSREWVLGQSCQFVKPGPDWLPVAGQRWHSV